MKSIVLSDRQKPRTLQLLKSIYAAHLADEKCELKENCPQLKATKAKIEELERESGAWTDRG